MSYVISFALASLLTGGWLWGVARWSGFVVPTTDLLIIVGLCNALALLPGWGWVLAMLILSLLVMRTADGGAYRPPAALTPRTAALARRAAPPSPAP